MANMENHFMNQSNLSQRPAVGSSDWLDVTCGIGDKAIVTLCANPTTSVGVPGIFSRIWRIRKCPPANLAMIVRRNVSALVGCRCRRPMLTLPSPAAAFGNVGLDVVALIRVAVNYDLIFRRHEGITSNETEVSYRHRKRALLGVKRF